MSAAWLRNKIVDKDLVKSAYYDGMHILDIVFEGTSKHVPKRVRVYVASSGDTDDYLINQEFISRAIENKATHVVYDIYVSGVTKVAEEFAKDNNIIIYPVAEFLSRIDNGIQP